MVSKPYKPRRDYRFEYIWDAIRFVEERQCHDCVFKSDREHYPMCFEIESFFIDEESVPAIDDRGDDGVHCEKYRNEIVAEQEHPDQERLFG